MKNAANPTVMTSPEYRRFIEDLKARVISARISAARAVNRDLILLYWDIGQAIVEKQQALGWGDAVVEMVAADLRRAFSGMRGFSRANVWRMRQLHLVYSSEPILAQLVRELAAAVPLGASRTSSWPDQISARIVLLPPGHRALRVVAQCPAQPDQSWRV